MQSNLIDHKSFELRASKIIDSSVYDKEYVDAFISKGKMYSNMNYAKGDIHNRHRLRWAYKGFEVKFYENILYYKSPTFVKHFINFHYSLWIFLGFIFLFSIIYKKNNKNNEKNLFGAGILYLLYVVYCMHTGNNPDYFTLIDMGMISMGLYFAYKKNILFFSLILFLALSSKETALAFGLIYTIINWKKCKFYLYPLFLTILFFAVINFETVTSNYFYDLEFFLGDSGSRRVTLATLNNLSLYFILGTLIETLIIYSPILFKFKDIIKDKFKIKILFLVLIYSIILFIANAIGQFFQFLIIVPFIILLIFNGKVQTEKP